MKELERIGLSYPDFSGAHALRAQLLAEQGEYVAALAAIDEAIRRSKPSQSAIWRAFRGNIRLAMGMPAKAVADFEQAVTLEDSGDAYNFGLASALACSGQLAEASQAFSLAKNRAGLWGNPPYYKAAWIARAWILATASDDTVRDGNAALKDAVNFWTSPVKGVGYSDRLYSDAVELEAASRAEIGEFEKAVELQRKAIDAALEANKPEDVLVGIQQRLDLYQSRRPYRVKSFCPASPPRDPFAWILEFEWDLDWQTIPFDSAASDSMLSRGFIAQGGRPCVSCISSPPGLSHSS